MKMHTSRPFGVLLAAAVIGFGLIALYANAQDAEPAATESAQPPASNVTVESAPSPAGDVSVESAAPAIPDTVADVGGDKITSEEFKRILNSNKQSMEAQGMPSTLSDEQQRRLVNSMIDQRVLLSLAAKANIVAADADVEAEIAQMKTQLPSEDMFPAALAQMGVTVDEFTATVRKQLAVEKYIENATKDLALTDQEMTEGYEKLKAKGQLDRPEETFDVSHILVKVDGKDEAKWEEGKKKIDAARERITKGEAFADVAKEVSEDPGSAKDGGAYTDVAKGMMVPEFDKAMAETPIGQISEPFRTEFGWHILTVTGKNAPGTATMEEVKDRLEQYLMNSKKKEAVAKLLSDAKAGMDIKVYYPAAKPADAAQPAPAADAAAPAAMLEAQ